MSASKHAVVGLTKSAAIEFELDDGRGRVDIVGWTLPQALLVTGWFITLDAIIDGPSCAQEEHRREEPPCTQGLTQVAAVAVGQADVDNGEIQARVAAGDRDRPVAGIGRVEPLRAGPGAVAAEHKQRAVGEVEHVHEAEDEGEAGRHEKDHHAGREKRL